MKMNVYTTLLLISGILFIGCNSKKTEPNFTEINNEISIPIREYSIQSVMWQQNAAEYRALCYQAFNTAKMRLDQMLENKDGFEKSPAIITDIDETVLDNSPYNAKLIQIDEEYSKKGWSNWTALEIAEAVPGAADFLNYAKSKNVEVFYVTNRHISEKEATIKNMKKVNFPYADKEHLLLMDENSDKEDRFNKVRENHTVLLYMGDNASDFSSDFRASSTEERNKLSDELKDDFGVTFIVLPNPMYGDWENRGIYKNKYDLTNSQKDSIRRKSLRAYK